VRALTSYCWRRFSQRCEQARNPSVIFYAWFRVTLYLCLLAPSQRSNALPHFATRTGVKPSSGYMNIFTAVDASPASMVGAPPSRNPVTSVHIVEIGPGSCPRLAALTGTVSYALIPQTTNEIRYQPGGYARAAKPSHANRTSWKSSK
jgi:hypothetical protein